LYFDLLFDVGIGIIAESSRKRLVMESIDLAVLRNLAEWRTEGQQALLATVIRTWGSSPRPVGAMMAMRKDGKVVGSVSGGCIEDDLIYKYVNEKLEADNLPTAIVKYGVTAIEAHQFGLPCGGTIELLLEFSPCANKLGELLEKLDAGRLVRRSVRVVDGGVMLTETSTPSTLSFDGLLLQSTLGPGYRLLLIGAGALSEYLATMAVFNGFSVTVCDPREEYRSSWSVPGVKIVTCMPDDAVSEFKTDQRCCIVALTHDPKLDDLALLVALHSPAFYVGAIGSRRNSEERRRRLIEYFNETDSSLRRLRGPIGIYIGSKTPAEIAVSVIAEILAVKNGVALSPEMLISVRKEKLESCGIY